MNRKFYLALAAVLVLSILLRFLPPVGRIGSIVRELSNVPAIGALCYALYQLARDRIAHDRSLLAQQFQNSFTMGATSHMAIVAFDKHVAFSEEYVSAMFEILTVLFREGPCSKALEGASTLTGIRKRWELWITPQVEADLERFEAALRTMGVAAHVVEKFPGSERHGELVKQMYSKFAEVMGSKVMGSTEWEGKQITEEVALFTIIGKFRKVLGVEELTNLRARLVSQALERNQQT
jgi:hypothetical protein